MSSVTEVNGQGLILRWVLGLFASALVLLSAGVVQNVLGRISAAEGILAARGERIALLEAKVLECERARSEFRDVLQKIEHKLDIHTQGSSTKP